MIDIKKQYKTRTGVDVRIYATDAGTERPVHGAITYDGKWFPRLWTAKGTTFEGNEQCRDDLIEVNPRIKREVWVNVYPNGVDDELWFTKAVADQQALTSRIACVRLTIDCEDGDGL